MAGAKAVLTSEEKILIAVAAVAPSKPACNKELDNLFSVISSDVAFE